MQLTFLPEIDEKATKQAVEQMLEKYRIYKLQVSLNRQPTITADYSFMPRSYTGTTSDSTANAAIANSDYESERIQFLNRVHNAINRLTPRERAIIVQVYLADEPKYDYEVYNELNMSERQYYRVKNTILIKMGYILNESIYKSDYFTSK